MKIDLTKEDVHDLQTCIWCTIDQLNKIENNFWYDADINALIVRDKEKYEKLRVRLEELLYQKKTS